eukprot:TRINITY_DN19315_c0_g1_i2.p1 TRINITY_DN19315_c0_g1~~TRINITY_DN19315_c0_g1_i2.p1  ORF type:complete len:430 (+),score=109.67 TRINITY_DN19315_c0_g1_i2:67-1356(+)
MLSTFSAACCGSDLLREAEAARLQKAARRKQGASRREEGVLPASKPGLPDTDLPADGWEEEGKVDRTEELLPEEVAELESSPSSAARMRMRAAVAEEMPREMQREQLKNAARAKARAAADGAHEHGHDHHHGSLCAHEHGHEHHHGSLCAHEHGLEHHHDTPRAHEVTSSSKAASNAATLRLGSKPGIEVLLEDAARLTKDLLASIQGGESQEAMLMKARMEKENAARAKARAAADGLLDFCVVATKDIGQIEAALQEARALGGGLEEEVMAVQRRLEDACHALSEAVAAKHDDGEHLRRPWGRLQAALAQAEAAGVEDTATLASARGLLQQFVGRVEAQSTLDQLVNRYLRGQPLAVHEVRGAIAKGEAAGLTPMQLAEGYGILRRLQLTPRCQEPARVSKEPREPVGWNPKERSRSAITLRLSFTRT